MIVRYLTDYAIQFTSIKATNQDNIVFIWSDSWDDFGYKTTLNARALFKGKEIELPRIKMLIKDANQTSDFLKSQLENEWSGDFPLTIQDYISVPTSISFYELLIGEVGIEEATTCARYLHDASYLSFIEYSEVALSLLNEHGFKTSLQRDNSSVVVFKEGYKLFNDINIKIEDTLFQFDSRDKRLALNLTFSDEKYVLPSDINVLIGSNGIGKSQTLHKIVTTWLTPNSNNNSEFSSNLNISNLIVVSYSPFELFPVDLYGLDAQIDESIYNYYGLRKRQNKLDMEKSKIILSRAYPQLKAAQSLLNCAKDDVKYGAIKNWSNKIQTLEATLEEAFDFDFVAIEIDFKVSQDDLFENFWGQEAVFINEDKRYLKVNEDINSELNFDLLEKHTIKHSGVIFFKDGHEIKLSSGQRLFSYIVINILGAIKKNSLILVDEPELFLHPSLEISFISMLKKILKLYFSKAILATHSLVTVREIPRVCVHVYKEEAGEMYINNPPFETFGGDVQRISSYVFGDKSTSKPYEAWIKEKLAEYKTAENLIDALGSDINEEMMIQIHAMEQD